ncbi:MAG: EutN/CcmL family microcompartment protein [Bacteroidota bacterium]
MKLGRVIGKVVSTRKAGNTDGLGILIVKHLDEEMNVTKKTEACIDTVSAGEGDIVMICSSSSARLTARTKNVATDSTIVGIVDSISTGKEYRYKKTNNK